MATAAYSSSLTKTYSASSLAYRPEHWPSTRSTRSIYLYYYTIDINVNMSFQYSLPFPFIHFSCVTRATREAHTQHHIILLLLYIFPSSSENFLAFIAAIHDVNVWMCLVERFHLCSELFSYCVRILFFFVPAFNSFDSVGGAGHTEKAAATACSGLPVTVLVCRVVYRKTLLNICFTKVY